MNGKQANGGRSEEVRPYLIHAITPVHAGVGEGLGFVNLPTAREQLTGYPLIPGSTVKGILRDAGGAPDSREVRALFGPPAEDVDASRGALSISDANLLALPVRSLFGTFAWVTSPNVLRRLKRDLEVAHAAIPGDLGTLAASLGGESDASTAITAKESALRFKGDKVYLLDFDLRVAPQTLLDAATRLAAWLAERLWPDDADGDARTFFQQRFLVVADDLFARLTNVAMEIRHRVRIDEATGTAHRNGPWTEELLPAESVLHGVIGVADTTYVLPPPEGRDDQSSKERQVHVPRSESADTLATVVSGRTLLRFGGKSSVGMGRAAMVLVEP